MQYFKVQAQFPAAVRETNLRMTGRELSSENEAYLKWIPGIQRAEGKFYTVKGKPDSTFVSLCCAQ